MNICRDKKNTPSGFTLKLRKHIRTRRLEDVRQLGYDRVYWVFFSVVILTEIFVCWCVIDGCLVFVSVDHPVSVWIGSKCTLCYIGAVCSREYSTCRF